MCRTIVLVLVSSLFVLSACNGGSAVHLGSGDGGMDQSAPEVESDLGFGDVVAADLLVETATDTPWLPEVTDIEPGCEPGEGCVGDPCEDNKDCLSGWCVEHLGEAVCTDTCVEDCPAGWSCRQVGSDPDTIFICVSDHPTLCIPCATGADCMSGTGTQVPCVLYDGEGAFCGGACEEDGDCPDGYHCQEAQTTGGATVQQCVSDAGVCECTDRSVDLGLSTPCGLENDFGSCDGFRVCTELGLSACDAMEAAPETCDGKDEDCDGEVDEGTCDDGNPCTEDLCHGEDGCEHVALNDVECPDGDLCTVGDQCDQGLCVGIPVDCDDADPCTDDSCDPETGDCSHGFNMAPCDDLDPCTVADQCAEGACVGVAIDCDCMLDEDCGKLEDGDLCNGTLYCDTGTSPHLCKLDLETLIECPEPEGIDAPCLAPSCDPETGTCGFAEDNEGFPCDNGDPCSVGDICEKGECLGGVTANCNDGNPCTDDSCDPASGCAYAPNDLPCEDGDVCTVGDQCEGGECIHGGALACDDGNPCTDDACNPAVGCVYSANLLPCDDGNLCTENDTCTGGTCQPGKAIECDDGDVCTTDSCDPLIGCFTANNNNPCDDGNACTWGDQCAGGTCQPAGDVICDDGNVCTDDSCDPTSGCAYVPNTASCTDGNLCTENDLCAAGICEPGTAMDCDDGNLCTTDTCNPTTGCQSTDNFNPCDDGDACTLGDLCGGGACLPGQAQDCDDGNVCTDDACDPVTGCTHGDNTEGCDDGNLCTVDDVCAGSVCLPGASLDCNDDNLCTTDSCNPTTGCANTNNTNPCDDNSACTTGDTCSGGLCLGTGTLSCDDGNVCTDDVCDADGGCTHTNNTAPCTDGNECTSTDTCAGGVCQPGVSINCDDGEVCTTDSCNPTLGCVHGNNTYPCDDGDACTTGDKCSGGSCTSLSILDCDDGNVCTDDSCDPFSGCKHANNILPCNDGNTCTTSDICAGGVCAGSGSLDCDDGNPCTQDICLPGGGCSHQNIGGACDDGDPCTVNDACVNGVCIPGATQDCDDGNPCTDDSCDLTGTCQHGANSLACDDGNPCTLDEQCVAGACVSGTPMICDDGNPCTTEYCSPASGCVFSNNSLACDDGNACTTGDVCVGGSCTSGGILPCNDGNLCTTDSCDTGSGCVFATNSLTCDDGNLCTEGDACAGGVCLPGTAKACDDGNLCTTDSCAPLTGCGHVNNSNPCNDNNLCTTTDQCVAGACVGSGVLPCSDGNICTDDACHPSLGCVFTMNVAACDDGNPCTPTDVCSGGVCQGSGSLSCDDGNSCTSDSCDPDSGCVYTTIYPCCGNGLTEAPEECDDGNQVSGDGCDANCQSESNVNCDGFSGGDTSSIPGWTEHVGDWWRIGNQIRSANTSEWMWMTQDGSTRTNGCVSGRMIYGGGSGLRFMGLTFRWTSANNYVMLKLQDNNGSGRWDSYYLYVNGSNTAYLSGGMNYGTDTNVQVEFSGSSVTIRIDPQRDGNWDYVYNHSVSNTGAGLVGLGAYLQAYADDFCVGDSCQ